MGDVLRFRKPRALTIKGHAREIIRDAIGSVDQPHAIVVVVIGENGTYAMRTASKGTIADFDMYSRAGALMDKERMNLIATE